MGWSPIHRVVDNRDPSTIDAAPTRFAAWWVVLGQGSIIFRTLWTAVEATATDAWNTSAVS